MVLLLQAVAGLHPQGAPDEGLIDALSRLTAMPPLSVDGAAPAQRSPQAALPPAPAELILAATLSPRDNVVKPGPVQSLHNIQEPIPEMWRANGPSITLESQIELIVEQAGLAAPAGHVRVHVEAGVATGNDTPPIAAPSEGLFPPNRARAILRELSTLPAPSHTPDIAAAVGRIARALPITDMPRRMVSVLGHEVQLLFDAGPGMLPFTRDKQQLASTAMRVLGSDRVRVADFLGAPTRGVRPQRQVHWSDLRWPGRRSAVLVISDLGIGEQADGAWPMADAWLEFLNEAAWRDLRTAVLIPYPHQRWPAIADRFGTAQTWDLNAGVQSLRRALRKGG